MISSFISNKTPLIYYSYRQIINENGGRREINAANKITVRKHDNYSENGLEFLIYNCALSPEPEICNGIRQTKIIRDEERIDFEGKGVSGNGIPLNNIYGVFTNDKGMLVLTTAKKNRNYIYHYLNCYCDEDKDIFHIDMEHISEFFRSTFRFLKGMPHDSYNTWFAARACVLNHYYKKMKWQNCPFSDVSMIELDNMHNDFNETMKKSLLKIFENALDNHFYEAYQYYRNGDKISFQQKLNAMLPLQGVYYLIYSTLI